MATMVFFSMDPWCLAAVGSEWIFSSLWAIASGVASMLLYARCSPQQRLKDLKVESAAIQQQLTHYDGDFSGAMVLVWRNLQLSVRRLGCALLPSLIAGLPVLLALCMIKDYYVLFFSAAAVSAWLSKWIFHIS
ncbi:MAG: hypothetical protein JW829_20900 [Pirellulales bacterium]|nr:hypothetical protein [Pirellulales bacterium]